MDSFLCRQHGLHSDPGGRFQQLPGRDLSTRSLDRKTSIALDDRRYRAGECPRNPCEREFAKRDNGDQGLSHSGYGRVVDLFWQPLPCSCSSSHVFDVAHVATLRNRAGNCQCPVGV